MSKLIISPIKLALLSLGILSGIACTQSHGVKKHNFVNKKDHSHMRKAHQKSTSVISVEALANDQFKVEGTVTAHEPLVDGVLLWSLPSGSNLVSGSLSEAVSLEAGKTETFEIVISGLRDNGKIVLLPHKVIQGEKHGTPTLYVHGQKVEGTQPSKFQKSSNSKKVRIFQ